MKCLAIIPARSGSKGLKDKNIRLLNGKPLISYSLEAAVRSNIFDEIMLSTDSEKYAEIAKRTAGVNVPFLRDQSTSGDAASTWDVVREVLNNYKKVGKEFEMFCILQPTSPLRNAEHITEAYELFNQKKATAVVSVCKLGHSINICNTLPENMSLVGFLRNPDKYARQMNPDYYRLNGALYMCDTKAFLLGGNIYTESSYAYIMDEDASVDIDCLEDFRRASSLIYEKNGFDRLTFATFRRLQTAIDLIHSGELMNLSIGMHEISEGISTNVIEYDSHELEKYEVHKKHIDIHCIISGEEKIAIADYFSMDAVSEYDEKADSVLGMVDGTADYHYLKQGQYCVIMPGEAHCPGIKVSKQEGRVKKLILKIHI